MEIRFRLILSAALVLLPCVPLSLRLIQLQIFKHRQLDAKASGEFERVTKEFASRGDILDRNGNTLAHSIPSWSCFIDKNMVKSTRELSQLLSPKLRVPEDILRNKLSSSGRFVWVKENINYEEMTRLSAAQIPSLGLVPGQTRHYPNDGLARNVIGGLSGDGHGSSGLEWIFDASLNGNPRRLKLVRDGTGKSIYKESDGSSTPPPPLKISIDRSIQFYSEEALREAAEKHLMKSGTLAVQDPATGEILAMAAYPVQESRNPLIQDTFEPGSTFKVITAAAALEEELYAANEMIDCENGRYELAKGVVISDHEPATQLDLSGVMTHSSNIGIAKIAARLGPMRFYRHSRAFGFAGKTGIQLPGESAGKLKDVSDLNHVTLAAASYGYGVGVTPLQLINAYSAIANGGTLWEPQLIADGRKPARVRRVAGESTIARLTAMLENVVEAGTGQAARIDGYRVAGKTGTARKLDWATKEYSQTRYTASFVGFLPVSRPAFTILVVIDEPTGNYYGAQVAAPIFSRLGRKLLALRGIPPDKAAPLASR